MIYVSVGTHTDPFDRLVEAAGRLAQREEVVVQRGTSRVVPGTALVHDVLPPPEHEALVRRSRVLVCHAGPSTLAAAWTLGRVPVVVPRDPARGEHVDAHQLHYAATLAERAVVVLDVRELADAVDRAAERRIPPLGDGAAFAHAFGRLVDQVVARRR